MPRVYEVTKLASHEVSKPYTHLLQHIAADPGRPVSSLLPASRASAVGLWANPCRMAPRAPVPHSRAGARSDTWRFVLTVVLVRVGGAGAQRCDYACR